MTTAQTKYARELVSRIECALAALRAMVLQERPEVASKEDITTLSLVAEKLEGIEDAWGCARIIADGVRQMADAADERDTYDDAFGPALQ